MVSPNQSFGEMAEKAMDYLYGGVLRVRVVDPRAQSITVFVSDSLPITYRGETMIRDELLPGLEFSAQVLFLSAGLY